MSISKKISNVDTKIFLIVVAIVLIVYLFTSSGHRYSPDEAYGQDQALRIVTQQADPLYVQGQSSLLFEYPTIFPTNVSWFHKGPICHTAILCYPANIGYSLTEAPFIFINHNLHIITWDNVVVWTAEDFDDPNYVYWRNTQDPDFTFLGLFYGPVFSALSVGVFFLVCQTFEFDQKNSIILTFLYGLTTTIWAYSHTSLNIMAATFFILFGFLYFRKFQKKHSIIDLIFSGAILGFAFLIRQDMILFMMPLFLFFIFILRQENQKIKKFFSLVVPLVLSYVIYKLVDIVRFGLNQTSVGEIGTLANPIQHSFFEGAFGLLLSPGVGLLIFSPIIFSIFLSFPDFYKRNRMECLLFLSFAGIFLVYFGSNVGGWWHGLVAWGARYLVPIIPFLLLPLGASIEKRKHKILKISLVILGALGFFFNLVYVVQDVGRFVWGTPGGHYGLFSLGNVSSDLYINPAVIWSVEFSQLTQSIITAFSHLQPDILLLKILEAPIFGLVFVAVMIPMVYYLFRLLKSISYIKAGE